MATISGGIFDFISTGYEAQTWSGGVYPFGTDVPNHIYQLSPDVDNYRYIYAATNIGMSVVDVETEAEHAYVRNTSHTSVWNSDILIFMGTTSGIDAVPKDTVASGGDLSPYVYQYKTYPELTAAHIKYLHGTADYLACTTESGVDFIYIGVDEIVNAPVTMTHKCFVCSDGKTYYTTSGTPNIIYRSNTPHNLPYPTVMYTCGSGYLEDVPNVNDIFVTENTSAATPIIWVENTLFIAASGGAYVFDEGTKAVHKYLLEGSS